MKKHFLENLFITIVVLTVQPGNLWGFVRYHQMTRCESTVITSKHIVCETLAKHGEFTVG